jgi:peptidoglycan hydrolase CwlO-like protein
VNNIPKDIEQKLNLNKELLTRNSFLENIIKNVNSNCLNLTFENSNFQQQLEILSKEKQQIYDENNKLIEKISHCENNIKYFQNVLYDIEMYLVEHNDVSTVKRYLLNTLKPSKKRKYIL